MADIIYKLLGKESTHRRQKLTLQHLFTDMFNKEIFAHSSYYLQSY